MLYIHRAQLSSLDFRRRLGAFRSSSRVIRVSICTIRYIRSARRARGSD